MKGIKVLLLLLITLVCTIEAKKRRQTEKDLPGVKSDKNLCKGRRCGRRPRGSMCQVVVNKKGEKEAACVCPTSCNMTDVSPICSVFGREYPNKCSLHIESCKKRKNIKIAFEGPCVASQLKCQPQELKQFPFRLLDWFIHLKDADEFSVMDPKKTITTIALEERKEVAAWKFQMLDQNNDRKLTSKEMKNFRYSLMPLEHCARKFFKKCDKNKNKKLEESEWFSCLVDEGWEWYTQRTLNQVNEN